MPFKIFEQCNENEEHLIENEHVATILVKTVLFFI